MSWRRPIDHHPVMIDHLIVGGGTAGCLLANRLSADPARRVLLLEAGPRDTAPEIRIPAGFHKLLGGPLDWNHRTDAADDPTARARRWPMGRVLGGSSSLNAMIWMRGHPSDYDAWAEATGDRRWSASAIHDLFVGLEDHWRGASRFHGAGGPVRVEALRDPHPLSRCFLEACAQTGIARIDDFNGLEQAGASFYDVTQRRGERWSAARAFLDEATGRGNLEVRTDALVHRVVFDGDRAMGVEVEIDGRLDRIDAGEVIVSAGAVGSPHLLLRSGIGPAPELERVGVEVVHDAPAVGRNLQDHPCVPVAWRTPLKTILDAETLGQFLKWKLFRKGMLTSNVAEAGAMLRTGLDAERTGSRQDAPDIQFHFIPAFAVDHGTRNPPGSGFTIGVTLVRIASRGCVRLASADPRAAPVIEAGTFSDEEDLDRMVEGVRIARRVGRQAAFDAVRTAEEIPGEAVSDDDLDLLKMHCLAEHQTLYHPVGTVAMGSGDGAPLSPDLRVRGIRGLRVIDASVMPRIPNANTNAPTMAVAETGARIILGD
jgi:choline dehydrogenase-like flavoprotein